jgi:hypothetical protein
MTAQFKVSNISAGEARMDLNKQWARRPADERFLNLSDLQDFVDNRTRVMRSVDAPISSYRLVDHDGDVCLETPNARRALTHWSFGQLAQRASAPASYLRDLPASLAVDCLTHGLKEYKDVSKFYYNADEIRAITSPTYGRIYDGDIVQAVRKIAGNGTGDAQWKIPGVMDWSTMLYDPHHPVTKDSTTLFASDRDVWMFLVDDLNPIQVGVARNGEPDYLFRGFYVGNSEVGSGVLVLAVFYLRGLCCNRIMWGVEEFREFRIKHTRFAPDRFVREVAPSLRTYAQGGSSKVIEGVRAAQSATIAKDDDEAITFLRKFGLSGKRSEQVLKVHLAEELKPVRTVWDAVNGITATARDEQNTDTRIELELVANKMIDKVKV